MTASQRLAAHLLHASRLGAITRRHALARGAFILMFHGIAASRIAALPRQAQPALTRVDLEMILEWLSPRVSFLTPDELLAGTPGVLLTFDDGFANNVEQALPVLEQHLAPAIWFLTLQHLSDPEDWLPAVRASLDGVDTSTVSAEDMHGLFDGMSVSQLQQVAHHDLITIGAHSLSHPFLTQCPNEVLASEVSDSRRELQDRTGRPIDWFAYPYGDYDARVAAATQLAGYRAAVVENCAGVGLPWFEIPRIGVFEATPAILEAKLSGLFRTPWRPPAQLSGA